MVLFINRPSISLAPIRFRSLISTVSMSTHQQRRKDSKLVCTRNRRKSNLILAQSEPKRGRYDCSDPDFISDFLSIHEEETPEVRYFL